MRLWTASSQVIHFTIIFEFLVGVAIACAIYLHCCVQNLDEQSAIGRRRRAKAAAAHGRHVEMREFALMAGGTSKPDTAPAHVHFTPAASPSMAEMTAQQSLPAVIPAEAAV